jgi:CheY-like chemotaxis protein
MRERVAIHHGTLYAGPGDEHGFTVRARLPIKATGMTIRVLIADDEALVRRGFTMILDAEPDLEVVGEAHDGQTAVEAAAAGTADVVLMDIRMPGIDGIEATRQITAADGPPRSSWSPPSASTSTCSKLSAPVRAPSCSRTPHPNSSPRRYAPSTPATP